MHYNYCASILICKIRLKKLLYILLPIFLFIYSDFSVASNTAGILSTGFSQGLPHELEGEVFELFSDDLVISRTSKQSQERTIKQFHHSPNTFLAFIFEKGKAQITPRFDYPFTSYCKQALCFGLLFLQQLF